MNNKLVFITIATIVITGLVAIAVVPTQELADREQGLQSTRSNSL